MKTGRAKQHVILNTDDRKQLESIARSRTMPAAIVNRAKIILMSAKGLTDVEIGRYLGLTRIFRGKPYLLRDETK